MNTFRVATRTQAALFECELKGQISDGHWENAYPLNHWKAPCNATVVVDADKQGRDFYAEKTYAFAQSWLCNPKHIDFIPECHDRAIAYAKAAKHFIHLSIEQISEFSGLLEGDWAWTFDNAAYVQKRAKFLELTGTKSYEELKSRLDAVKYTTKDLHRDLTALSKAYRQRTA